MAWCVMWLMIEPASTVGCYTANEMDCFHSLLLMLLLLLFIFLWDWVERLFSTTIVTYAHLMRSKFSIELIFLLTQGVVRISLDSVLFCSSFVCDCTSIIFIIRLGTTFGYLIIGCLNPPSHSTLQRWTKNSGIPTRKKKLYKKIDVIFGFAFYSFFHLSVFFAFDLCSIISIYIYKLCSMFWLMSHTHFTLIQSPKLLSSYVISLFCLVTDTIS